MYILIVLHYASLRPDFKVTPNWVPTVQVKKKTKQKQANNCVVDGACNSREIAKNLIIGFMIVS